LLASQPSFAAEFLRLDAIDLNDSQARSLSKLLAEIEFSLPPIIWQTIARPLSIKFADNDEFSRTTIKLQACDSTEMSSDNLSRLTGTVDWLGEQRIHREISLNPGLKSYLTDPAPSCRHKNSNNLIKAAIIHQVALEYDLVGLNASDQQELIKLNGDRANCEEGGTRGYWQDWQEKNQCQYLINRQRLISDSYRFMKLAHFRHANFSNSTVSKQKTHFGPGKIKRDYTKSKIIDFRELDSSEQSFAVNMEYFLLDSAYSCRRPGFAQYFSRHFAIDGIKCQPKLAFGRFYKKWEGQFLPVDPSRVYQIHVAKASPCKDEFSCKYGHFQYLVIQCAPHRKKVGPECLKDYKHFFSIEYHAYKDDWTQLWKLPEAPEDEELAQEYHSTNMFNGFVGKYVAMQMHFFFTERIDYYVKQNNREYRSYPLNLTDFEKRQFLYNAFENFLYFRSSWYHLANNCVTLGIDLLQSSVMRHDLNQLTSENLFSTPADAVKSIRNIPGLTGKGGFYIHPGNLDQFSYENIWE